MEEGPPQFSKEAFAFAAAACLDAMQALEQGTRPKTPAGQRVYDTAKEVARTLSPFGTNDYAIAVGVTRRMEAQCLTELLRRHRESDEPVSADLPGSEPLATLPAC